MKKIAVSKIVLVIILIVSIVFIQSCKPDSEQNNPEKSISPSLTPIETDTNKDALVVMLPLNNYRTRYGKLDEWQALIKEKFNLDLEISYISEANYMNYAYGSYVRDQVNNGYEGLVYLWQSVEALVHTYSDEQIIMPLTEYLKNNDTFSSLPETMRNRYRMDDGEIWAIPAQFVITSGARLIKADWLENLGLELPETLDEFYEVTKALTNNDPNRSGTKDTHGIAVQRDNELMGLIDIFLANGCYIDQLGYSSINMDRSTGTYEDALLKDEAKDTLQYILNMINEGLINRVSYADSRSFESASDVGSFFTFIKEIEDREKNAVIWYLNGTSNQQNCFALTGKGCYVMSSGTSNPQDKLDKFLNTFYSSPDGYYMALAGIEGVDYKYEYKILTEVNGKNSIRVLEQYAPFLITEGHGYVDNDNNAKYVNAGFIYDRAETLASSGNLFYITINDGPYEVDYPASAAGIVGRLFDGNTSIDDLLAEYRNIMSKAGYQQIIDDMNRKIGKQTNNSY